MRSPRIRRLPTSARRTWGPTVIVFTCVLAIYSLWIWQGVDLTDEGFHLTNQWMAVEHPASYEVGPAWLSDVLGGLWLSATRGLGLLGARLGWALCMALTAASAFVCIRRYFPTGLSAFSVICAGMALGFHGVAVLDYNAIPAFFLITGIASFLSADSKARNKEHWIPMACLAGAMLGLGVASRFPLIVALLVPFMPPMVRTVRSDDTMEKTWRVCLFVFSAAVATLLLTVIGLWMTGDARDWLSSLARAVTSTEGSHAPTNLLAFYYANGVRYFRSGIRLLIGSSIAAAAFAAFVRCKGLCRLAFLGLATVGYGGYLLLLHGDSVALRTPLIGLMWCSGLALVALLAMDLGTNERRASELLDLVLLGLFAAAIQMLGSNTGFFASKYAMWLLFPAVVLTARELIGRLTTLFPKWRRETLQAIPILMMVALAGVGCFVRAHNPYRDLASPRSLTAPIDHPQLRLVFTSAERAKSLEELLHEMRRWDAPETSVLAWKSIPMLHYLTETLPPLGNPWVSLLDSASFDARWAALWAKGGPDLVVESHVNTRLRTWAVQDEADSSDRDTELHAALETHDYEKVWGNDQFSLWISPDTAAAHQGP